MKKIQKFSLLFILIFIGNKGFCLDFKIEQNDILTHINDNGKTEKVFDALEKNGHWVEVLTPGHLNELPVGLKWTKGNVQITIAVTKVEFTQDAAYISLFAKVVLPKTDKKAESTLFLGAEHVRFYREALKDAKLVLLENYKLPFKTDNFNIILKGGFDKNTGAFGDLTYLIVDCRGPQEFKISADVVFSRKVIIPLDNNYLPIKDENAKVKSSFSMVVNDWNDMLIDLEIPPFCPTKNQRIGFSVSQAILDFSDTRNDAAMSFPDCYNTIYSDNEEKKLWRGFYCKTIVVSMPKEFKNKANNDRVSFGAQNLYIDNYGITGDFFVTNVLKLGGDNNTTQAKEEGDASGWAFSVDSFTLKLELDHLKAGGFTGKIQLPVSKNGALSYRAYITENDYMFAIKPGDTIDFAVFKSKFELYPSSTIIFEVKDDRFKPKAILNGQIVLNFTKDTSTTSDSAKALFRVPKIYFQELTLQTVNPYVTVAAAGYEGSSSMQKFPITIQKIGFSVTNSVVKLDIALKLNLMNTSSQKFGAEGGFAILGKIDQTPGGRQKWKYDKYILNQVKIDADLSAFSLKGAIDIYNDDEVYGSGFRGAIQMTIKEAVPISVDVLTYFGKKTSHRYWLVDGTLTGVKVALGPAFILTGFGGGACSGMSRTSTSSSAPEVPSGITYLPDTLKGLSFKASVFFVAPKKNVCNGSLTFEMVFNSNGGLNKIGMFGVANFIDVSDFDGGSIGKIATDLKSSITKVSDNSIETFLQKSIKIKDLNNTSNVPDGIKLQMAIEYDFTNTSLHASANVYMKLLQGLIHGGGANNLAGYFDLYVDPNTWHVNVGEYSNKNSIVAGVGSITANFGNYYMVGNDISSESPPLPSQIVNLLGDKANEISMIRNTEKIQNGTAICFGASASISTGNITCLVLYGSFDADFGFDIMMRKYGKGAHCEGSNAEFGFKDWYLMGRAYAYIGCNIGITIGGTNYNILQGSAAVVLQTRFPNPSWFEGNIVGEYDILYGAYHDNFSFKVTIGTYCNIQYGKPQIQEMTDNGLQVIDEVSPMNEEEDVDVYARPVAYFNTELNTVKEYEDGRGVIKYKIKIQEFILKYGANKDSVIAATMSIAPDNKRAFLEVTDYIPEGREVYATVRAAMYQVVDGNDVLMTSEGLPISDTFTVKFTSGYRPQKIALNNIASCYPIPTQKYLYINEDSAAYVNLLRLQDWVMLDTSVYLFVYINGEDTLVRTATLSNNKKGLSYYLPTQLKNLTEYQVKLIRIGQSSYNTSTSISEYISNENIPKILEFNFSTSRYNTFKEKLTAIQFANANIERIEDNSDVLILGANINNAEPFDYIEMSKEIGSGFKMITAVAKVDSDYYFIDSISNLIYPDSTINDLVPGSAELRYKVLTNIIPVNAYLEEAQSGYQSYYSETTFPYIYNLAPTYKKMYIDARYNIVNSYMGTSAIANYSRLVTGSYPAMPAKTYQTFLQYRLPNGTLGTSGVFTFKNELY
jgi:hypothetical protein